VKSLPPGGRFGYGEFMGRPKRFSREGVLEKAIPVFWKHGFSETTLQDLEKATGVNKSGLYAEFKDKEDLFTESLRHYLQTVQGEGTLTKQPPGWSNIEQFLKQSYGCFGQKGCFSVNSMREFADVPSGARQLITDSMAQLHRSLQKNIEAEHPATKPAVIAELVLTVFMGICVEQNIQPSRAQIARKIENFLQMVRKI